jgi:hypothetical protein
VPNDPSATRYVDKSLAYLEIKPLFAQGRIETCLGRNIRNASDSACSRARPVAWRHSCGSTPLAGP